MEKQLAHFARYMEHWADTGHSTSEMETWYRGDIPLPHPEWGPAETIYQSLLRTPTSNKIRGALGECLSEILKELSNKENWTEPDRACVLEMFSSCRDLAPVENILSSLLRLCESKAITSDADLVAALRQALIYNQDGSDLKELWLGLLEQKPQKCFAPAPLSDIRGVCRLGENDKPDWPAIAKGIGLYANFFKESRERRPMMHSVWKDLAEIWNKEPLNTGWNLQLIQEGIKANWEAWVFETLPKLYLEIPVNVYRYADNCEPDLSAIVKGIGDYANLFKESRVRRQLMHSVWKKIAEVCNKELLDSVWNWQLIQEGIKANWERWVFETLPSLYGKIPNEESYYLWDRCTDALEPLFKKIEFLGDGIPVGRVEWTNPEIQAQKSDLIAEIEQKRLIYSWKSSDGLAGVLIDKAAEISEPIKQLEIPAIAPPPNATIETDLGNVFLDKPPVITAPSIVPSKVKTGKVKTRMHYQDKTGTMPGSNARLSKLQHA